MKTLLSVYFLALGSILFASSDSEVITTIILINRQAELVDVSLDGEVMKRHVAVPDYFSSGRSHQSSLKNSLNLLKDYGSVDHILPGSSNLSGTTLQSYILTESSKRSICISNSKLINNGIQKSEDLLRVAERTGPHFLTSILKPHNRNKKVKNKVINRQISFAEVFMPSVGASYNNQRQHNHRHTRSHRGFFKDT